MTREGKVRLTDGRTIAYAEQGDPSGYPVFYFHGIFESRLSCKFMENPATLLNIRLIAPDRPGIGLSTFQSGRQLPDWGNDVVELAHALQIDQYSILGISEGAPYVLACLLAESAKVKSASIICGTTPGHFNISPMGLCTPDQLIRWLSTFNWDFFLTNLVSCDRKHLLSNSGQWLQQFMLQLSKPDNDLMNGISEYSSEFIESRKESYRQGIHGAILESKLLARHWQFDLNKIEQSITLWYGTMDNFAPPGMGLYYKLNLPNSSLHLIKNEGHFSLIRNHIGDIMTDLRMTD